MTDSAIIVGASSGIGEHLARELARDGYEVGLAARRLERLQEIGEQLPTRSYVARMDVTDTADARAVFDELFDEMDGADVVVLSAGVAPGNPELEWERDKQTIDTNVRGFTALANAAVGRFEDQGHGHLVGISSVAAHTGLAALPAYSASKAYVSNYLEGLRLRSADRDADLTVTTIEPGYVDTDLSFGGLWECSPETAARQIHTAIRKKKSRAFVTRRWRVAPLLLAVLPDGVKRRVT